MKKTAVTSRRQRFSRSSRVDILPLVDVMFLLLAFFIVVTMSMVLQKGIFVNLAKAESGESASAEHESIVITVDVDGVFHYNKDEVNESQLKERLSAAFGEEQERDVFINGDGKAIHDRIMKAVDIVRQVGFSNVVFTVEPVE